MVGEKILNIIRARHLACSTQIILAIFNLIFSDKLKGHRNKQKVGIHHENNRIH
jgi:hypothetical protein